MRTLVQDLRYGLRLLMRAPGFTLLAAGVLALGIGALAAVFSLVDAALLRPLPFSNPGELVMLWEKPPGNDHNRVSPLNFQDWHDQNHVFSHMAAVSGSFATLQTKTGPERLTGQAVTWEFFPVFGVNPLAARAFTAQDETKRADVAVLSEALWRNRWAADRKVLRSPATVNGTPSTSIGIVPGYFGGLWKADRWRLVTVKWSPGHRRLNCMQMR